MVVFELGCHCAQSCWRLFTEVTWPRCYWAFKNQIPTCFYFPTSTCFDSSDSRFSWGPKALFLSHLSLRCYCGEGIQPFALKLCWRYLFGYANFINLFSNHVPLWWFLTSRLNHLSVPLLFLIIVDFKNSVHHYYLLRPLCCPAPWVVNHGGSVWSHGCWHRWSNNCIVILKEENKHRKGSFKFIQDAFWKEDLQL